MTAGPQENSNERRKTPVASHLFADGRIAELVYCPQTRSTSFAVFRDDDWTFERQVAADDGTLLVPFSPENNLIKNDAVLLPSEPLEYGSGEALRGEIRSFLRKYVDLTPDFEAVATSYVLLTWVYDAFNEVPYLRLRGDFGTGKTRTLLTIGSISYKPFFASGASTISPIFHTLDAFRGTLIFDEADFRFSDERAEIVKILNNGNVRGMPVFRTIMNAQKEFNPRAFQVFGPKIVATRGAYEDKGLESRFLTEEMGSRPLRSGIPINLPEAFREEARELRNKLLLYRFRQRRTVRLEDGLADRQFEPRFNQILLPLLSATDDERDREALRWVALRAQTDLLADRGQRPEAQVLEVLTELLTDNAAAFSVVPVSAIAARMVERFAADYERPITNRWVGGLLRKRLNLRTYKSHGVYVVPNSERGKVEVLCARYGVAADTAPAVGDVGTSRTSGQVPGELPS